MPKLSLRGTPCGRDFKWISLLATMRLLLHWDGVLIRMPEGRQAMAF
jgi:hypothetical protein